MPRVDKGEWSRCFEGFSNVLGNGGDNARSKSRKRKSTDTGGFGHGNIFEKLGLGDGNNTINI